MRTQQSYSSAAAKNGGFPAPAIRVLLADDDPSMLALIARILARNQRIAIVGAVPDGRRAVRYASTLEPDLVLTDLHMPEMDGAQATHLLKQLPHAPAVFVVTSDDRPEVELRCLNAGADAFLPKRFELATQLLSTIETFFGEDAEKFYEHPALLNEPVNSTR